MSRHSASPAKTDQQRRQYDEQAFLDDRAVAEATPLPEDETDAQAQAHRIIPGNRAEAPLPTLEGTHIYLTPSGGIDRPRTPPHLSVEDSRELLTRLTGLQPWQLEAFPDELPPLPISGPGSPTRSPEHARPTSSFSERRLSSSTAVPIRFRKPPVSPAVQQREFGVESEPASSPVTQTSPFRRHAKSPSKEFKTSREFRPLYLVERNRKSDEIDSDLPALPSSRSPSRASSAQESEIETEGEYESAHESADYESAFESPHLSAGETSDDHAFFDPLSVVTDLISSAPGPEVQHPELRDREIEELNESGQATPKASDFVVSSQGGQPSTGPSHDALRQALEHAKAEKDADAKEATRASPLAASPFFDDRLMRDAPADRSEDYSPTKSSSLLQEAALGALAGGVVGAALGRREPSPERGNAPYVPTFVEDEADWAKNKPGSLVADDDTLVGEASAGPSLSASKEMQREKVLEATEPHEERDVEARRSVVGSIRPEDVEREILEPAFKEPQEEKKINAMDFLVKDDGSLTPTTEEPSAAVPEQKIEDSEVIQRAVEEAPAALAPPSPPKAAPAPEPARSSWGSGLWGAIGGWGRKKAAPAPAQTTAPESAVEPAAPEPDALALVPAAEERKARETRDEAPVPVQWAPEVQIPASAQMTAPEPAVEPAAPEPDALALVPVVDKERSREIRDEAPVSVQWEREVQIPPPAVAVPETILQETPTEAPAAEGPKTEEVVAAVPVENLALAADKGPLTLDTQAQVKQVEEGGYKSLPRNYTPQTAFFTDDGRPFGFGLPRITTQPKEESSETVEDIKPDVIATPAGDMVVPKSLVAEDEGTEHLPTVVEQPKAEEAVPPVLADVPTSTADEEVPKMMAGKKKKGKKGRKASTQLPEPITEPVAAEEVPVKQATESILQETLTQTPVQTPTPYFGDSGVPAFTFPQRAVASVEPEEQVTRDVPVVEQASENAPAEVAEVAPEPAVEQKAAVENEPSQYAVPQTSYFGDGGVPAFSFPITSPAPTEQLNQTLPEAPAVEEVGGNVPPEASSPKALVATDDLPSESNPHPTTKVEIVPSVREIIADVPGVEPMIDVREAVEMKEQKASSPIAKAASVIEEAPVPSKKKGKKGKKKRESALLETSGDIQPPSPTVEVEALREGGGDTTGTTAIDAAAVPLPDNQDDLQEPLVDATPAEEAAQTPSEPNPTPLPEQSVEMSALAAPAEEDWGPTPKKKGKKGKKRSGVLTPEVQAELVTEPVTEPVERTAPETEHIAITEPVNEERKVRDVSHNETAEAADGPMQDVKGEDELTQAPSAEVTEPAPVEADIETDAWLEGKPLDHASTLLEKENPLEVDVTAPITETPTIKTPTTETPTTEAPAVEAASVEVPAVVEQVVAPLSKKDKKKKKKKGKGTETPIEEVSQSVEEPANIAEPTAIEPAHETAPITVAQELVESRDVESALDEIPAVVEERTDVVEPIADAPAPESTSVERISADEPVGLQDVVQSAPEITETQVIESKVDDAPTLAPAELDQSKFVAEPLSVEPTPVVEDETSVPSTVTSKKDKKTKKSKKGKSVDEPSRSIPETELVALPVEAAHAEVVPESSSTEVHESGEAIVEAPQSTEQQTSEQAPIDPVNVPLPAESTDRDIPTVETPVDTMTSQDSQLPDPTQIASAEKEVQETIKEESVPAPADETTSSTVEIVPALEEPIVGSKKSKKKKGKKSKAVDTEPSAPATEEPPIVPEVDVPEPDVKPIEEDALRPDVAAEAPTEPPTEGTTDVEEAPAKDLSLKDEITRDILEPAFEQAPATEPGKEDTQVSGPSADVPTETRAAVEEAPTVDSPPQNDPPRSVPEPAVEEIPTLEETQAIDQAPAVEAAPTVDPFAGLSKAQRKKLEKKMKAEAAQKEAKAAAAPAATGPVQETPQEAGSTVILPAEIATEEQTTAIEEDRAKDETVQESLVPVVPTGEEASVTEDQATPIEAPILDDVPVLQEATPAEETPTVDLFKGLTKNQKKKLQQKMKAEAVQKEAEAAALAVSAPIEEASQDQAPAVDDPSETVPIEVEERTAETPAVEEEPSVEVPTSTEEGTAQAKEADTEQSAQGNADVSRNIAQLSAEEQRVVEEAPIAEATPAVDPFAGLNKMQRKKLQQKMEAEAAQKLAEKSLSPTEPVNDTTERTSSAVDVPVGASLVTEEALPVQNTPSVETTTTAEETPAVAEAPSVDEVQPVVGEPIEKVTQPDDVPTQEEPVSDAAVPPPEQEASTGPLAGLNKKERKKLEKKLKAEVEAAEKEAHAGSVDEPTQETAHVETSPETIGIATSRADVSSEAVAATNADDAPDVDTSTLGQPTYDASDPDTTEQSGETPAAEQSSIEVPAPKEADADIPVTDASPITEVPPAQTDPADPFKGLSKKQRQKLEKKLKAEAEAKRKEEEQAAAEEAREVVPSEPDTEIVPSEPIQTVEIIPTSEATLETPQIPATASDTAEGPAAAKTDVTVDVPVQEDVTRDVTDATTAEPTVEEAPVTEPDVKEPITEAQATEPPAEEAAPIDPFEGLSRKQRQKLEKKLKAEAEARQKEEEEAQAAAEPAQELAPAAKAEPEAAQDPPTAINAPSEAPAGVEAALVTSEAAQHETGPDTADTPTAEPTIEQAQAAESNEAELGETVPVDPFAGLSKKQRQKLEKKLKAEAAQREDEQVSAEAEVPSAVNDKLPAEDVVKEHEQAEATVPESEVPLETTVATEQVPSTDVSVQDKEVVEHTATEKTPDPIAESRPKAEQAPIIEPATEVVADVDPFAGLSKAQRKKLEKKLKAEAAQKERDGQAVSEVEVATTANDAPPADDVIEEGVQPQEPTIEALSTPSVIPGQALTSEEPTQNKEVVEPTATEPVSEPTAEPALEPEQAPLIEPSAEVIAEIDPFAGLNKSQRKKLERKLKAEAAQKKDEEVVRAQDANEGVEASKAADFEAATEPAIANESAADDTWPAEDMLTEDVGTSQVSVEQSATDDGPSGSVDVAAGTSDEGEARGVDESVEAVSALGGAAGESLAVEEAREPSSKKDKKKKSKNGSVSQDVALELATTEAVQPTPAADATADEQSAQDASRSIKTVTKDPPADDATSLEKSLPGPVAETEVERTQKEEETPATELTVTADTTESVSVEEVSASSSKKSKKKKKGKKGGEVSEPQTPITEISEPVLPPTVIEEQPQDVAEESTATAPADIVEVPLGTQDSTTEPTVVESILEPTENATAATSTAVDATEAVVEQPATEAPIMEETTAIVEETSSSKKSKKKAKKDKRASVAESEPSTPLEAPAEETLIAPLEQSSDATPQMPEGTDEQITEPASTSGPILDATTTREPASAPEPMLDPVTEEVQASEQETVEEAPILSKKDKKKAKKNKRISIAEESLPSTPLVEEHKQLSTAEQQNVEPSVSGVTDIEQLPSKMPVEVETTVGDEYQEGVPTASETRDVEGTVAERSTMDPTATELSVTEPTAPEPPKAPQEEEPTTLSKKDKKKAKKAKRVSIAESSEPATPTETPAAELNKFSFDASSASDRPITEEPSTATEAAPEEQTTSVSPVVEEAIATGGSQDAASIEQAGHGTPVVEEAATEVIIQEEPAPMSKKDKKKVKKAKRTSVVDTEPSEPATPLEASTEAAQDQAIDESQTKVGEPSTSDIAEEQAKEDQQTTVSSSDAPVEAVPNDRPPPAPLEDPEPLPSLETPEPVLDESAPLSKAQKKKAKKAKRASAVESEVSQPATPAEEVVKELVPEPEPTVLPATEEPAVTQMLDEEVDAWTGTAPSKKDKKKKNKKQQNQTAIDSFLADEATRAANVSEPQPSPSTPTTSETPLTFSGIPTQYSQTDTDGSVELATTSARGLDDAASASQDAEVVDKDSAGERDVTLLDAATEQREVEKVEEREREQLGDVTATEPKVDVDPAGDIAEAQPEPALELQTLVPVEGTQAAPAEKIEIESEFVPADAMVTAEKEDTSLEPASAADTQIAPANEGDLDSTTSSKKKKTKKNKRASTLEEPAKETVEAASSLDISLDEDAAQPATEPQVEEQVAAPVAPREVADKPVSVQETKSEEPVVGLETIDIAGTDTSVIERAAGDAEQIDIAPTVVDTSETASADVLLTKKDKKKSKKIKKQSGTVTPTPELASSIPVEALDALATPQIEEAQAVLESHTQLEAPPATYDETGRQAPTVEPAAIAPEALRDALNDASGPTTEEQIQDVRPTDTKQEPIEDKIPLSKKDKKKAKKAKKQSGAAMPEELLTAEKIAVVEKETVAAQQEIVAEDGSVQVEASSVEAAIEPGHEPAEFATQLELQQEDAQPGGDADEKATDVEETKSAPAIAPDTVAELEQKPAELATQLEPQQEVVQLVNDRDINSTNPEETHSITEKDIELAVPVDSQTPTEEPAGPVESVEPEVPPALSKKEKKKNKKSKKQPASATPAGDVATEEVKETAAPDAAKLVAEPAVEPMIEPVIEPTSESRDVAVDIVSAEEQDLLPTPVDAVEKSVEVPVIEQVQGVDGKAATDEGVASTGAEVAQSTHVEATRENEVPAPLDVTTEPVQLVHSAEDEWGYTPSKKGKKKGKEARRSDAETPVTEAPFEPVLAASVQEGELAPLVPIETTEQLEAVSKESTEDIVLQEPAVPEPKTDIPSTADAPGDIPVVTVEEESSALLSKKNKKKAKKSKKVSGTATPVVEDVAVGQLEDAQGAAHIDSETKDTPVDDGAPQAVSPDTTTAPETITAEVNKEDEAMIDVALPATADNQPHEIEQVEPTTNVQEPAIAVEELAIADDDTATSTSKKSKKKKKKSAVVAPLVEDAAPMVTEGTAPTTDLVAPIEGNVVTEADRVVLSDILVSDETNTTTEITQPSENDLVGPSATKVDEDVVEEQDVPAQTVVQEPVTNPASTEISAPEPLETERPVLSRKLSKKEKRAKKKGIATPLEDNMVVETATSTQTIETTSTAMPGEVSSTIQEPEAPAEMETFVSERPVEPAVEPITEPVAEPVIEPVTERHIQASQDEPVAASVKSEPQEVITEEQSAATPKKGKKSKKVKKQLLVPEPVDEATSQPIEAVDSALLPESVHVDVPAVETAAVDTPLPEPTPMEVETPAITEEVVDSRAVDIEQRAVPEAVDAPLPEPTPMEGRPDDSLLEVPEAVEQVVDDVAVPVGQDVLPDNKAPYKEEEVVAETQEVVSAPLSRKASKKSKKAKKTKDLAESSELTSQTKTDVIDKTEEDTVMQESSSPVEPTAEISSLEREPESVETGPTSANIEIEPQAWDVESTQVKPTTVPEPTESSVVVQSEVVQPVSTSPTHNVAVQPEPSMDVEHAPAPIEVLEEPLTRSTSKKDKKKKKKGKRDADRIEEIEDQTVEVPASVEETLPTALPEPPIAQPESSSITATHEIEAQRPATPVQDDVQLDAKPRELSPSLQALRDETADLRQRSDALDLAVAANEQHNEPSVPQPTSMFDVADLLSKKDKEADAPRDSDLPEPATPAAEPQAAVETTDQVESVVEGTTTHVETPSRKLSKKEKKKKAKQAAVEVDERTEPAVEDVTMTDAPTDAMDSQLVAENATVVTSTFDETVHEVETKDEVIQNPVLTPSAESTPAVFSAPNDNTLLSQEPTFEEQSEVSRKLSKKDKKKQAKLAADAQDYSPLETREVLPVASFEPPTQDNPATVIEKQERMQVVEPTVSTASVGVPRSEPTEGTLEPRAAASNRDVSVEENVDPAPAAEDVMSPPVLTRKESKKGKKKSRKSGASSDVALETEQPATLAEPLIEQPSNVPDRDDTPSTTIVGELQHAAYQPEPVQANKEPEGEAPTLTATEQTFEETGTVTESNDLGSAQPSAPAKTFDGISEDVLPTLNKKGSKKHRLAALFEQQSPEQLRDAERSLGHKRSGSVKNLAERFESQSRPVTPLQIVPQKSISRAASKDQLRSVSPFDKLERLRSASPRHNVDFAAAVAAGLNESGFDPSYVINDPSFYRSRSTSRQEDHDTGPDDEVATARRRASVSKFGTMGRASASTSPTKLNFASNSPTKDTAEPIDRTLPKGIEVPLAATETPSFDPMDVLNDPAFARRKSPPGVLEEADPEELYAPSKNKQPRRKKKRTTDTASTALSMQDSVEQTAAETPVLGTPFSGSRAVEVPVGSTTRELGFETPVHEPVRTLDILEQSLEKSRKAEKSSAGEVSREREERGRSMVRDEIAAMPSQLVQKHKSAANADNSEYPFPQVLTPEVRDSVVRSLKEEKNTKSRESRKSKGAAGLDVEVSPQEPHKRRTHPVSFHEDQPEEKRLHKSEAPSGPSLEPPWSFSALDNNTTKVGDTLAETPTTRVQETVREKRQHPQGPRTPRKKSVQDVRGVEASPILPEYLASRGVEASPASDFVTKERTSYLFDSSPSTRVYDTSSAVAPKTPNFDSPRTIESHSKTSTDQSRQGEASPTRASQQAEPYQSIFGDPSEKKDTTTTPIPKRARTPGTNSLGTITESSPDGSPLFKKGRSVTDVGSAERGAQSLRRTERNRSFSDRIKSPPPTTPTPANRRSTPSAHEVSSRQTSSRDSPWHQANDPVDRSVALSPARRLPHSTPDPIKHQLAEIRDSPGLRSQQSLSNISKLRSPDTERPMSSMSMASNASNHSLRRVEKTQSGDLRAAAKLDEVSAPDASSATEPNLSGIALAAGATAAFAAASKLRGEGKGRRASMAETFVSSDYLCDVGAVHTNSIQEAMGEAPRSPMSPTRPPSLRKRQSMQITDLQTQLDQLAEHNQSLENARLRAEETLQAQQHQRQVDEQLVQEAVEARDRQIHQRDIDIAQLRDTLQRLQDEIARLTELNNNLTEANRNLTNDANERYAHLQSEGQLVHQQWQTSQRELESLRSQHDQLTRGVEGALREEIGVVLDERNAEISRLERELSSAREQIKGLQKQILASKKPSESFLTVRDEDYFDSACQQLCQHVQQWVLRFSKFSDTRACRLSSDIQADVRLDAATREKIDKRLDNAILDGSDVDALLADRVRRRDVFMSIVMAMIWEYVFTRYLFGMDREQRQKLKSLEKTLSEVGEYIITSRPYSI